MITEFTGSGIDISGGEQHLIENCAIGTDLAGTAGLGNGIGIKISSTSGTIIGSIESAGRNIISSNTTGIEAVGATSLSVLGNFLETAPDGATPLPNIQTSIVADASSNLMVGSPNSPTPVNSPTGVLLKDITRATNGIGAAFRNLHFNLDASGSTSLGPTMQTGLCIEDSEGVTVGGGCGGSGKHDRRGFGQRHRGHPLHSGQYPEQPHRDCP